MPADMPNRRGGIMTNHEWTVKRLNRSVERFSGGRQSLLRDRIKRSRHHREKTQYVKAWGKVGEMAVLLDR
jgi:hypothetical protein